MKTFKDGNQWCAVDDDFVNLHESIAGFGATEQEALEDFVRKHTQGPVGEDGA